MLAGTVEPRGLVVNFHQARSNRQEEAIARDFIAMGIDDLAKYRIVRFCCERPDLSGDASFYSTCLGFHSVAVTGTLLDELVASGILAKVSQLSDRGHCHYRLRDGDEVHRRLIRLLGSSEGQEQQHSLFRALASRSLAKAGKLARISSKRLTEADNCEPSQKEADEAWSSKNQRPSIY